MRGWVMVGTIAVVTIVLVTLGVRALLRGRRVPTRAKLLIVGAILWLLSPIDVLPDFAGPVGLLDDIAVLIATVRYVLDQLEPAEPTEPMRDRLSGRRAVDATDRRLSDDGHDGP